MYSLNRTRLAVVLVVAIMAALFAAAPQAAEASTYEGTIAIDCAGMDATDTGAHILDRDNTGSGEERIEVLARDGAGNVILDYEYQSALGSYAGGIGDFTWDSSPVYNPIIVQIISVAGNGLPAQVDTTATGTCEGLPIFEGATTGERAQPGCVALTPIPSDAVVGRMVAPATLYANPGAPVGPQTVLEPGNTAWVLGIDSSGAYYQILWSCNYLWVPREAMGPNFDDVWHGTPLPTEVVS